MLRYSNPKNVVPSEHLHSQRKPSEIARYQHGCLVHVMMTIIRPFTVAQLGGPNRRGALLAASACRGVAEAVLNKGSCLRYRFRAMPVSKYTGHQMSVPHVSNIAPFQGSIPFKTTMKLRVLSLKQSAAGKTLRGVGEKQVGPAIFQAADAHEDGYHDEERTGRADRRAARSKALGTRRGMREEPGSRRMTCSNLWMILGLDSPFFSAMGFYP